MRREEKYVNLSILDEERQEEKKIAKKRRNAFWMLLAIGAALVALIWAMTTPAESAPPAEPVKHERMQTMPEVDVVAVDPLEKEKAAIARTVWGEARGCSTEGQEDVIWTVLARYDDGRFGDTILEVVSRPNQFDGYRESNPVDPEILATTERIMNRWLDGDPGPGWLYFWGDGRENHFRR